MFIPASQNTTFISSSMVKQVAMFGGDIGKYVPDCIHEEIVSKLNSEFTAVRKAAENKNN